jgi:hypothetical protein
LILSFASDDYNGSPDTGWTESTGMEQQTFHGGYKWWRVAVDATNSFTYTIGSATESAWVIEEWSGLSATPYDISAGQFQQSFGSLRDADAHTDDGRPAAARDASARPWDRRSPGHPGRLDEQLHGRQRDRGRSRTPGRTSRSATAYRAVTGDGVTGFSTGATWTPQSAQSATAMIAAFNVAGTASPPVNTVAPAVTGTATQGQTLTTDNGTWTNSPTGYTYQWQRYTP